MWCCSLLGSTRWSPSTVFGGVVPRRALLWPSLSLPSGGGSVFLYAGLEGCLHLPYIHMAATARDLAGTQLPTSSPAGLGP